MPPKSTIETHPKRKEIDAAIVAGESFRAIAARFKVSSSSVNRYIRGAFAENLARARQNREMDSGYFIFDQIAGALTKIHKMINAIDEWMTDPEDPEKYTLAPRASEIVVVYERLRAVDDKIIREKDTLQNLLSKLDSETPDDMISTQIKSYDVRKLMLEAFNGVAVQLRLYMQQQNDATEQAVQEAVEGVFDTLRGAMEEVASQHPELREPIAEIFTLANQRLLEGGG